MGQDLAKVFESLHDDYCVVPRQIFIASLDSKGRLVWVESQPALHCNRKQKIVAYVKWFWNGASFIQKIYLQIS
jgi:hypothetical protein